MNSDSLCLPKKLGGLGIRKMEHLHIALLQKRAYGFSELNIEFPMMLSI